MLAAQLTGLVLHRSRWDMAAVSSLRVTMERIIMNKDKAMRPAFLTAALIALTGCASTPPMTDPEQRPSEEITIDDCGKQPVRTRMSSMPPRLVIYRACKAQVRSGGKASEATKE